MNYTDLVSRSQEIAEDSLTTAQINHFIQQAEQKIYHTVQFPDMRKNCTASTEIGNEYLEIPTGLLWVISFSVTDGNGDRHFLLNKDVNFIREGYPDRTDTGLPRHYGYWTDEHFILGPTPDAVYVMDLSYGHQPESIVTAVNTWLGDNFDSALLNGTLLEIARFQAQEADIIANYERMYEHSITLLRNTAHGKMRQDMYRSGQPRIKAV